MRSLSLIGFFAAGLLLPSTAVHGAEAKVAGHHLRPASAVTMAGGTVKLKLVHCSLVPLESEHDARARKAPAGKLKLSIGEVVEITPPGGDEAPGGTLELTIGEIVEVTPQDQQAAGGGDAAAPEGELRVTIGEVVEIFPKDKGAARDDDGEVPEGKLELRIGEIVEVTPARRDKAQKLRLLCEGDEGYERSARSSARLLRLASVRWKVDGPGRVVGDTKGATYSAPPAKPTPDKAVVSATLTYSAGKKKTILLSNIKIVDKISAYTGRFSVNDVTVNSEYARLLTGTIRWKFDEYYAEGGWREYTGRGRATLEVSRKGCGAAATFAGVPVEGRMKVYDDKKYEFLIGVVSDQEQTRSCRRPDLDKDLTWEETFSASGDALSSGNPCGTSEYYPRYSAIETLTSKRKGGCGVLVDQFEQRWWFRAVE